MEAMAEPSEAAAPAGPETSAADTASSAEDTVSARLKALLKEDFEYQLSDVPEFATQAGFHDYDGRLQSLSPHTFEARLEHNREVLAKLDILDVSAATAAGHLTATEALHAELFRHAVEGEIRAIDLGCHLLPINGIGNGGVHESFLELLEWMRFNTDDDMQLYLDRLMSFPNQVDEYCQLLAYGACMKKMPPSHSMLRGVRERLKELATGELKEIKAPVEGKTFHKELMDGFEKAIDTCFRAGVQRLLDFIVDFYSERARPEPGLCALNNGLEVYAECLRFHTSTTKTAEEIHNLGLEEVARIENRFKREVLDVLGFQGSFTEFAEGLKADSTWCYASEEELLDGYRALVAKIEKELPRFFERLPAMPLEVVAKSSGPAAYYYLGETGGRPGRFYVNTSRLSERPKYGMPVLALHEGVPGHHVQGALAVENSDLPDFLRYIEDRRYEYGPARRPLYAAYLEGWALYCEKLGEEMGMYATPHDLFGRLSMEMMRAVRLVVDTGIHAYGWDVDRAAKYMEEKTGMTTAECEGECHRYASWPGQACAYKVGQLAIEDIRMKAEKELGDAFCLRAFHSLLLDHGPMPLDVLGQRAEAWVRERQAASAAA